MFSVLLKIAARISGSEGELMEDLDSGSKEDSGIISNHLKQIKQWLLSNRQYLNFFTILVLASVNPISLFTFCWDLILSLQQSFFKLRLLTPPFDLCIALFFNPH